MGYKQNLLEPEKKGGENLKSAITAETVM